MHRVIAMSIVTLSLLAGGCGDPEPPDSKATTPPSDTEKPSSSDQASLASGLDLASIERTERAFQNDSVPDLGNSTRFVEVAGELGIKFQYDNGATTEKLMTEATGGGAAWFDFDLDGFADLILTQGGSPRVAGQSTNPIDQLFQNISGTGFRNVTQSSGIHEPSYSQGVAIGDFDNDGFDDVYITNVGNDRFFQNQGDGTFIEQTESAGLINPKWGSSAAWADLDLDGDLDLFVCNYTKYDPEAPLACFGSDGEPGICHPNNVPPMRNCCFRNNGDGTFTDILSQAGMDQPGSKSLGIVVADFNEDALPDIFISNDTEPNHLFINNGMLKFTESGLASGCAVSGLGHNQASMGVAFGDYNRDGHPDLYITHFTSDTNTMYRGLGQGVFYDATAELGLQLPTLDMLGFGTVMADFNSDGQEELFIANGHIDDSFQDQGDAWKMPAQLFAWTGSKWVERSKSAGDYFQKERLGRGVATADFDNDGDLDLAVCNQQDDLAILRNERASGHWLKLRFVGIESNRRGICCRAVVSQSGQERVSQLAGGTSYCVTHQPVLFFGFGEDKSDVSITVDWPSGKSSRLEAVAVDQELLIREPDAL